MNSLFNSALKQSSSVRRDLDAFADAPATSSAALQGQISTSLTSLSRTIDDYSQMAKRELIPSKQEKAYERIKSFRADLLDYRQSFDRLKKDREETQTSQTRTELLGRRPHHASTPENPYATASLPSNSPFCPAPSSTLSFGAPPTDYNRETHALREQSFMAQTNAQLDEYLERGRAVLGDLGQQREMLKGTQRKLYSVANTLGVSGETIRMVERRARADRWVFWGGCVVFFGFCWGVIYYLR
ncbi:MAG: synaptobrevin [Lasallia pustulata]|uniref:Protein transport protein BOS1 n=1 Tax=Lasallia pustulata TaxID=136370 RepID=A0A5M8PC84_9LECA|nr:MAG: synaptobrevin [Lasallia pustulata]